MIAHTSVQKMHKTPTASLELYVYTLATPGGHWLKEVTANAAAIAPLIRCGWTVVDVREVKS